MYAHTHTRTHTHRHTSTHTLACGQNKLAEWKRRKAGQTHKGGKQSELYKRLSEWSLVSFRRHLSWPTSQLIGPKKVTLRMFLLVESLSHTHTHARKRNSWMDERKRGGELHPNSRPAGKRGRDATGGRRTGRPTFTVFARASGFRKFRSPNRGAKGQSPRRSAHRQFSKDTRSKRWRMVNEKRTK